MIRRLGDGAAATAQDLVDRLALREGGPGGAVRLAAVMIATIDGRAAIDGRSVALGHPDDRDLLRALRADADAVLVGSRTLEAERYATLLDPELRERRLALGLTPHPVVATVARRGKLSPQVPLLGEAGVPIVVFTGAGCGGDLAGGRFAADVRVVELEEVTVPAMLSALAADGVRGISCEGGPSLLREVIAAGAVDDLLLTIAPLVAAGSEPGVLTGEALEVPASFSLRDVHRADDHLFLHYSRKAGT